MSIDNPGFTVAAILSLFTWAIHTFLGGRVIARPLLQSAMKPIPKLTNYYCWHLVTLTLLAMTGGFAYAAVFPSASDLGFFLTLIAAAFCIWSLILVIWKQRRPLELPQWILFLSVTGAATWGVLS